LRRRPGSVFAGFRRAGSILVLALVAAPAAAAEPSARPPGTSFIDCPECPVMVVVPAGRFTRGSPPEETAREAVPAREAGWERPQHPVDIAAPFAIGKYPVTRGQWLACVAAGGCAGYRPEAAFPVVPDDAPVTEVSWNDAQAYIAWLNELTRARGRGSPYRLPSEAEWEYAARAGTETARWWGDTPEAEPGSPLGPAATDLPGQRVGRFPANPFGLYDMLGADWQWVADCWAETYDAAPLDGSARQDGDCTRRVVRGGSRGWRAPRRSAARSWHLISLRTHETGFRPARALP
jgi:formylglycine-generating enzyme required for sulfatase activity